MFGVVSSDCGGGSGVGRGWGGGVNDALSVSCCLSHSGLKNKVFPGVELTVNVEEL